jgi:hypothetical protein
VKDRLQARKIKCIQVEIAKIERPDPAWTQNPPSHASRQPFSASQPPVEAPRKAPHPKKKIDVLAKNGVSSCFKENG